MCCRGGIMKAALLTAGLVLALCGATQEPDASDYQRAIDRLDAAQLRDDAITTCWDEMSSYGDRSKIADMVEACFVGYMAGTEHERLRQKLEKREPER
jgi:hypothetical protein